MPQTTFVLLSYMQQQYIRSCIKSLLAQECEPIEILISDDASTDNTFKIINEEVHNYSGPHTVRVHQNSSNLGAEHYETAARDATGQFLIFGHGDDVFSSQRTSRLIKAWKDTGCSTITSNAEVINESGKTLGLVVTRSRSHQITADAILNGWQRSMLGATIACQKEVFTKFPAITSKRLFFGGFDNVLPFRGALLNGVFYLNEILLKWRQHARNLGKCIGDMTQSRPIYTETNLAHSIPIKICMLDDLEYLYSSNQDAPEYKKFREILILQILTLARHWSQARNILQTHGKRPTWVEAEKLISRGAKQEFVFQPRKRFIALKIFELIKNIH